MITRKQYMNGDFTHAEYYSQFISDAIIARVLLRIGADMINDSTDEHMNDIPIHLWDSIGISKKTGDHFRDCGDYPTLAGSVSLYKTAAKQIKAEL